MPSKPLTDITATVGMGAPQFSYLTVNPDSTIVTEWDPDWQ